LPLGPDMVQAVHHGSPTQSVFEVHTGVLKLVCNWFKIKGC
jgi:hypothetical protein